MKYLFRILICSLILAISCLKQEKIYLPQFIDNVMEAGSRFVITSQDKIIFSGNNGKYYSLKSYQEGKVTDEISDNKDIFQPFIYNSGIAGFFDNNGDERFFTTNIKLNKRLLNKPIRKIESSKNGNILIVLFKNDAGLYILNSNGDRIKRIVNIKHRYNGCSFSENGKAVYISYDDRIIKYDIEKNSIQNLTLTLLGEKRNIYLYKNSLFFNNNGETDLYQIYRKELKRPKEKVKIIYCSKSNVMNPKFDGEYLYFIECEKNEYLLKRKKINGNKIETLTSRGVVYQYDFYKQKYIAMIYSDYNTPKALVLYNLEKMQMINVSGQAFKLNSKYVYESMRTERSPSYIIKPDKKAKGIILFFHPGLHSDFSPRWDTILMALLENNYMIIAPNYPMSGGYGKSYRNMRMSQKANGRFQ